MRRSAAPASSSAASAEKTKSGFPAGVDAEDRQHVAPDADHQMDPNRRGSRVLSLVGATLPCPTAVRDLPAWMSDSSV